MAVELENKLGSYEKRREQIRRYELFLVETNNSKEETNRRPTNNSNKSKFKIRFHDGCVFLAACSSGSTDDVDELLKNPNTDINTTNVDGLTGLHQACINEDIKMVKFLIGRGIDVNTRDNEGWTALHAAAQSGFTDIARFLIENGAKIDLINCDCEIPLDLSQSDEMTLLLQDAMDFQGIDGDSARNAEERMMMEDIRKWMESDKYEDIVDKTTGATPLHVAAVKGYREVMRCLIQLGTEIDATDNEGWTPLHGAAHWGQAEACRLFAESHCNLNAVNKQGNTPLDVADSSVVGLLEELLEKEKMVPDTSNISRPTNKFRKSSITRISVGQMKDLQKKNEEDEKAPANNFDNLEDEESINEIDQSKTFENEVDKGFGNDGGEMKSGRVRVAEEKIIENKTDDVISEERIQSLLEERRKKLGQQRASDSNVVGVIMRRDVPKEKSNSDARGIRMIASDLMRRSTDPSLWRFGFRRSSNSENDLDIDRIIQMSEAKRMKKESGGRDEDKEQKRRDIKSAEYQSSSSELLKSCDPPLADLPSPRHASSSLLRPETAAALASIAISHQRLSDVTKRDDANELERKLKAKRARESRRSTQGVTKEDIQRAEDTLKAAYQDASKGMVISAPADLSTPTSIDDGSGDVSVDPRRQALTSSLSRTPSTVVQCPSTQSSVDSSVASIIEKWQKKDVESVGRGDSRNLRDSTVGSTSLMQKKEYSQAETLTLYRKIVEEEEGSLLGSSEDRPANETSEPDSFKMEDLENDDDSTVKSAASRARRKRESRRPTGKIVLGCATPDPDEMEESGNSPSPSLTATLSQSSFFPMQSVTSLALSHHNLENFEVSSAFPHVASKSVPFTTTSSSSTSTQFLLPHEQASSSRKYTPTLRSERWSTLSSSWQQQVPQSDRSSATLPFFDSSSNFSRTGNSGGSFPPSLAVGDVNYQELWEKEKLESDTFRKRINQLERDFRNTQLQLDIALSTSKSSNKFDRIDAKENRASERKLSELEEEKKRLEEKVSNLEEELKKVDSIKNENTKLRNENAALIRVISKLSK